MPVLEHTDFDFLVPIAQTAIAQNVDRVERALATDDTEGIIGASKDLVETVGKAVIDGLGLAYPSSPGLPDLAGRTMDALKLHPSGLQNRPSMQRFSGSYITALNALAELRNTDGTGHGRAAPTDLHPSHARFAMEAAGSWSRWVLSAARRVLEAKASINEAVELIEGGRSFRRGELPAFLAEHQLDALDDDDQHRLGLAVGRRWNVGGTFNVRDDVIEPLAEGREAYPPSFCGGVAEGLLIDQLGYVRTTQNEIDLMVKIGMRLPSPLREATFENLATIVEQSDASYAFESDSRAGAATRLRDRAREQSAHPEVASALDRIAARIEAFH